MLRIAIRLLSRLMIVKSPKGETENDQVRLSHLPIAYRDPLTPCPCVFPPPALRLKFLNHPGTGPRPTSSSGWTASGANCGTLSRSPPGAAGRLAMPRRDPISHRSAWDRWQNNQIGTYLLPLHDLQRQSTARMPRNVAMHQPDARVVGFEGNDKIALGRKQGDVTAQRIVESERSVVVGRLLKHTEVVSVKVYGVSCRYKLTLGVVSRQAVRGENQIDVVVGGEGGVDDDVFLRSVSTDRS